MNAKYIQLGPPVFEAVAADHPELPLAVQEPEAAGAAAGVERAAAGVGVGGRGGQAAALLVKGPVLLRSERESFESKKKASKNG